MQSFNEVYNLFTKCNKVFQKMHLFVPLSKEGGQSCTQFGPTGRITLSFWTVYVSSSTSTYTPILTNGRYQENFTIKIVGKAIKT